MSKRIILAGGTGFLGQSFAEYLVKKGYDVVGLDLFWEKAAGL